MSAFGTDDHQSLFAYLGGLIVLVFAGIILSLTLEKRHSSQRADLDLKEELSAQVERIRGLERESTLLTERLELAVSLSEQNAAELASLNALREEQAVALEHLIESRRTLEAETAILHSAIEEHQKQYREKVRTALIGTTHPKIGMADGSFYSDVTIRSIRNGILGFAHRGGFARVPIGDLEDVWKRKLSWDRSEAITTQGNPAPKSDGPRPSKSQPEPREEPAKSSEDRAEIEKARLNLITQRDLYRRAVSEAATARSKAYGSERSVPGSLETWSERATRMEKLVQKYRASYQLARSQLMALAPGDPLLITP